MSCYLSKFGSTYKYNVAAKTLRCVVHICASLLSSLPLIMLNWLQKIAVVKDYLFSCFQNDYKITLETSSDFNPVLSPAVFKQAERLLR